MKNFVYIILLFPYIALFAVHSSVTLKNGKILENAKFLLPTEKDIVVIYDGGIMNVTYELLPDRIRYQYEIAGLYDEKISLKDVKSEVKSLNIENNGNIKNDEEAIKGVVLIELFSDEFGMLGHGTGFFVGSGGHVVTNAHNFLMSIDSKKVDGFNITLSDGTNFLVDSAELCIPARDFLVIKLPINPKFYFKINPKLKLDAPVKVVGHPLDERWKITKGSILELHNFGHQKHFSISAEIKPGNSGGPIINSHYEVLGQAQYVETITSKKVLDNEVVIEREYTNFHGKCLDFPSDYRWSVVDISFDELYEFTLNYEFLEFLSYDLKSINSLYELCFNFTDYIGYRRNTKFNNRILDLSGKPIVTSDVLYLEFSTYETIRSASNYLKSVYSVYYEKYKGLEVPNSVYQKLFYAFDKIDRGILQIYRSNGMSFSAGIQRYNSGKYIMANSKNTMRDLFWVFRSMIRKYGPPDFLGADMYREFYQSVEFLEKKTGYKLLD